MEKAPPSSSAAILSDFIRSYAYGLNPRLDAIWLRAVAWQRNFPQPGTAPHPDEDDPYPPHR